MSKEQNKFGHLIDKATKTPRSINHCDCGGDKSHCFDCLFEVSCQLETELAEARAEIEQLRARNAILNNAIKEAKEKL